MSDGAIQANGGTVAVTSGSFTGSAGKTLGFGGNVSLDSNSNISAPLGTANFLNGTITIDGAYTAGATKLTGGTVGWNGSGTIGVGDLTVTNGIGNFNGAANVGTLSQTGGAANFNGATSLVRGALSAGTLGGTGTATLNGPLAWNGGMIGTSTVGGQPGTLVISPGVTVTIAVGASGIFLYGETLENHGTIAFGGSGGTWYLGNATTIDNFGLIDLQNDLPLSQQTSPPALIDNTGTFQKSVGTLESAVGVTLNNSGSVIVQTGKLSLIGGGTNSGSFHGASGTTLSFSGSSSAQTFTVSSSVSNSLGTVNFTFGSPTLAGTYDAGITNLSGGNADRRQRRYFHRCHTGIGVPARRDAQQPGDFSLDWDQSDLSWE